MMIRPLSTAKVAGIALAFLIASVACTSADKTSPTVADTGTGSAATATSTTSGNGSNGSSSLTVADKEATVIAEATGAFFLEMTSPADTEVYVSQASYEFSGRTTVDALVSVNDYVLDVDEEGRFGFNMDLEEGPNVIEVIASNTAGEQQGKVLLVIYVPA
ncbi:MAG: hypothetical protein O2788_00710 [Chloroflexi bacterium]|nr:hypothetical protein [Chloroflexota bacterium]